MNSNTHQPKPALDGSSNFTEGSETLISPYQFQDLLGFPPAPFSGDFSSENNPNSMNFQGFSNQFMQMPGMSADGYPYAYQPYSFMSYGYNYGNYYERKPHNPHKKKFNQGYTTTQRIYTKKPKQPLPVNGENSTTEGKDHSVKANGKLPDFEKLPHHIEKAKFFVIKSYSEEDVHKAIKHNLWCSTKEGNVKLHDAFVAADGEYPIYLLFSVNSSGYFVGVAQMKSHVDFEKNFEGWNQSHKWKGVFQISWIYIKDIPNKDLRHLKNDFNEGKPVPNSRDCQEVPFEVGIQVLDIFEKYKTQTSILDDYDYYEMQERARL